MWNPFILFLKYIQTGDTISVAARKLCSFYSFSRNHDGVSQLLSLWAKSCKIMSHKGELLITNKNFKKQHLFDNILTDLVNDAQVRIYLVQELGDDVFAWLQPDEIQELENGLLKYKQYPYDAVTSIGRALEDVLKRIYIDLLGFDAQDLIKKNGVSQLAECLKSKESIHAKQLQIVLAQAHIRNMGSHGKEVEYMEKWKITSIGVMGQIFSTLAIIRSLFRYVKYGELSY